MYSHKEKVKKNKSRAVANSVVNNKIVQGFFLKDNRFSEGEIDNIQDSHSHQDVKKSSGSTLQLMEKEKTDEEILKELLADTAQHKSGKKQAKQRAMLAKLLGIKKDKTHKVHGSNFSKKQTNKQIYDNLFEAKKNEGGYGAKKKPKAKKLTKKQKRAKKKPYRN